MTRWEGKSCKECRYVDQKLLLAEKIYFHLLCMGTYTCTRVCAPGGEQKKAWDSLIPGLQVVVSCYVGAGNQTLALRKCGWCS